MKGKIIKILLVIGVMSFVSVGTSFAQIYNYGDFSSQTLVAKAWEALNSNNLDAVLAYTNKCLELYEEEAKTMQASLSDFPRGSKEEIITQWWALNDVATALYIQAEAYNKAGKAEEAKEVYSKVISEFTFGQCLGEEGWFWKPSEAAKEKLDKLEQ